MKFGPKYKICRRLGAGVFEKCQTPKFTASEAKKGGKKKGGRRAGTDFALQLLEKQKIRFSYGVSEKQFYNYVKKAIETKNGTPTEKLHRSLESRLDNVVYRLGLASSRPLARQMVAHGHLVVNGKKVTVPSYAVSVGDVITVREGSKNKALFQNLDTKLKNYHAPDWLTFDIAKATATVKAVPAQPDTFLDWSSVLQFYSR